MKIFGLLLISVMAVGCASQKYGFRPAGNVMTAEAGYPAAHYPVPPESPRGEVFVTSFGTRDAELNGQNTQLIHARLAVANHNAETDWTVDPGQQLLVGPGAQSQRPDFMEVDGKHDGDTRVARGQRKVFDLYYRVPGGARDVGGVAGFDLQWKLQGGGQTFAEHTSFAREPYRDYRESSGTRVAVAGVAPWWAFGYGPAWWGGFGFGYYGAWGYPYYGYGYGYGPYIGGGYGYGRYGGGYRSYHGGGYGGGYSRGGGGGGVHSPVIRGRRP